MNISFNYNGNKGFRLLNIYERFKKGEYLSKSELAADYSVTEKTIQLDINDLRTYLIETDICDSNTYIVYDKAIQKYYMVQSNNNILSSNEFLAIYKIIIENRCFPKEILEKIIVKISNIIPPSDRKIINKIISEDLEHYSPLYDHYDITSNIFDFIKYIRKHKTIFLSYSLSEKNKSNYIIYPIDLKYKNNSFFLIAYSRENREFPTVFKSNQIINTKILPLKAALPNKQIDSNQGDKKNPYIELKSITFQYKGNFLSLIHKFPTAELLYEHNGICTVRAFYYGQETIDWIKERANIMTVL